MGFFERYRQFREGRHAKQIEKLARSVGNPKAIREDRNAAIEYFKDYPNPDIAIPALLRRFEFSLEHGINDTREKESAMDGITRHGEAALPIVSKHLRETTRIAWPIKIIKALASEEYVIKALQEALDYGDITFDEAKVSKNYDILCYLVDYKMPGFYRKLKHFLNDPDERVRFACTEVLIEQNDEGIDAILEPFLADESVENTRIRQAVIDAFLKKQWTVRNREPFIENQVIPGVTISKKGQLVQGRA